MTDRDKSLNAEESMSLKGRPEIVDNLNNPQEPVSLGSQGRAIRRQVLMVFLGGVGVLSLGLALGLPTVTLEQLQNPAETVHLTLPQATWYASLNTLSCPLGGLLSGFILDRIGRKKSLFVYNVISISAWALMALAISNDSQVVYIQLLLSRFIMGIAIGLASAPLSVYAAEIALPGIRGHLILGTSIATASGIMIIYLMGYYLRNNWLLIARTCCAFQFFAIFLVIPMPETPNWLISKGYLVEAKRSLNYFRGLEKKDIITHPDVQAEFNLMQKTIQLGVGERKPTFLEVIRLPEVYKPIIILTTLFAFQQLTGIFIMIVYAVQIATDIGVKIDPFLCAVALGAARVVTTCPMGFMLEKLGRRTAGLISAGGIFICMHLLAAYCWFEPLQQLHHMPVVLIVIYMVFSTIGIYTLPFIMISELFPQKARGPAAGLTLAMGLFIAFISVKTYPSLNEAVGISLTFVFFGIMGFLAMGFIYFFLPETRGRTLLEIEEKFRNNKMKKVYHAVEI